MGAVALKEYEVTGVLYEGGPRGERVVYMRDDGSNLTKKWRACVGAGSAQRGLRAEWQRQFEVIALQCGFEYVRLSNWGDLELSDTQETDSIIDFLSGLSVAPIIRLDEAGGIDLNAFVRHCISRYGAKRVHNWRFECEGLSSFIVKRQALKDADSSIQVGAVIPYAVSGGLQIKRDSSVRAADFLVIQGESEALEDAAFTDILKAIGDITGREGVPIHWDGIDSQREMADGLCDAIALTKRYLGDGYTVAGRALESISLVSFSGICKKGAYLADNFGVRQPAGHAFRMMDLLGGTELACGAGYIVTKSERGKLSAMAWSDAANPDALEIAGLMPYEKIMIETLDAEHGFGYSTWRQMGCPASLTRHQVQALKQAALQTDVRFVKADGNGAYLFTLPRDKDAIMLFKA